MPTVPWGDFAIITLDAENTFDNVSFEWLSLSMSRMSFQGPFIHLVNAMYTSPAARLVAAGLLSDKFCLYKGTRQGCPLSLLLFNLALESLSRYLTYKAPLHGISIGNHKIRTPLFTDDILVFSASPHSDMSIIKTIFDKFRLCSGLRINYSKSEILPIGSANHIPWISLFSL